MGRLKGHTRFRKGERVILRLKDGRRAIDHYEAGKTRFVFFRHLGKVEKSAIEFVSIYREAHHGE